ncbi:hypothetical protein QN277_029176 [Acacia crassicarpa]|uniref:Uncharacterized protein n=1 Tax=Acacia crassicarpa TaxID=499986 RepID=A0AAE1J502_9FABA|nr:hypothetical protein QN277_029176 [Acacia crassicarpa]
MRADSLRRRFTLIDSSSNSVEVRGQRLRVSQNRTVNQSRTPRMKKRTEQRLMRNYN